MARQPCATKKLCDSSTLLASVLLRLDKLKLDELKLREFICDVLNGFQGLKLAWHGLDPSTLNCCKPSKAFEEAFQVGRGGTSIYDVEEGADSIYLAYRTKLAAVAQAYLNKATSVFSLVFQDCSQTWTLLFKIRGLRKSAEHPYILEVQWGYVQWSDFSPTGQRKLLQRSLLSPDPDNEAMMTLKVTVLEAKLFVMVFANNMKWLSEEYIHKSLRKWGHKDSPLAISFIVPAQTAAEMLDAAHVNQHGFDACLESKCAKCNQPASSKCAKCQSVRYCSKECQHTDWPEHKGPCKSAVRVLELMGTSFIRIKRL
ncbi:hypothetical protein WJX73_004291 [Symbiochloris irregularis]|uniref:MYND-type domain-containing protein n=1 Tax=Symbiochloris irregularis TaxID=706552 RepID=A0AAW1PAK2_9CHLO